MFLNVAEWYFPRGEPCLAGEAGRRVPGPSVPGRFCRFRGGAAAEVTVEENF